MGNCQVHKALLRVKMSLTGPMGSNYSHSCCDKEISVTAILNQCEIQSGCDEMVHEVSETY